MKQLLANTYMLSIAIAVLFTACKKEQPAPTVTPSVTLEAPGKNASVLLADAMQTLTFRWTPLQPKPATPVTYRLRVWQLMQGQNAQTAMRENTPIVDNSTDINTATIQRMLTGPCRPPYLCDFVWSITVLERDATGANKEISISDPGSFSIN
jgi:hypothetical protein